MPPKEILPPVVYKSENDLKDNTIIIVLDPAQHDKTSLAKLILLAHAGLEAIVSRLKTDEEKKKSS
jgi:hypothetical protein